MGLNSSLPDPSIRHISFINYHAENELVHVYGDI